MINNGEHLLVLFHIRQTIRVCNIKFYNKGACTSKMKANSSVPTCIFVRGATLMWITKEHL